MGDYIESELMNGACADSVHDFKIPRLKTQSSETVNLSDVLITLPGDHSKLEKARSESDMLKKLLKRSEENPIHGIIDDIKGKPNKTLNLDKIQGLEEYNYTARVLSDSTGECNIRNIYNKVTLKEYDDFFNLNGDPLNIVVDAQTIGINKLFGYAEKGGPNMTINNIINREVINDPASKTYDVSKFNNTNASVVYKIIRDNSQKNIIYSSYDRKDDELYRNKFFSELNLQLSPLINIEKKKLPRINLDIYNKKNNIIHQSSNPHVTNAISSCWALIKTWFSSASDKHIKCSSFFQCKRSGDWLQGLSCIDIGRPYVNDSDDSTVHITNMKLVTHDRILLWYALFIGIDVIFTCSIPGASTAVEDEEEGEEGEHVDEDGIFTPDPTNTRPQKIMLYFTRSIKENPEVRLKRYRDMAKSKSRDLFIKYIKDYNTWVEEIVSEIENEIDKVYIDTLTMIETSKTLKSNIMSNTRTIIQLHWKLTAIDYISLKLPDKPANIDKASIETLDTYISECNTLEHQMSMIKTKNDMLYASNAYSINPEYTRIINPFDDIDGGGRKGADTNYIRCAKMCSYLQFRLPNIYIEKLSRYLSTILDQVNEKWPSLEKMAYSIKTIIGLFNKENLDLISDIIVPYLKKKTSTASEESTSVAKGFGGASTATPHMEISVAEAISRDEAMVKESVKSMEEEDEALAKKFEKEEYVDEYASSLEEAKKALEDAEGVLTTLQKNRKPDRVAIERQELVIRQMRSSLERLERLANRKKKAYEDTHKPPVPVKTAEPRDPLRKRVIVMGGMDVKEYAEKYLEIMQGIKGKSKRGGGVSEYPYILFLCYLDTLIEAITGYDSSNFTDYIFYDALARIVISAVKLTNNDYDSLLDLVYSILPESDWISETSFIENKEMKECIQVVAHNMALQSINLRSGDIPYIRKNDSNVLNEEAFKKITIHMRDMKFKDRQAFLINKIQDLVNTLHKPHIPAQSINPLGTRMRTGFNPVSREISRVPPIGEVVGGRTRYSKLKKKRIRKGSPKRRTLKKNRIYE